jgi:hypothetical protein
MIYTVLFEDDEFYFIKEYMDECSNNIKVAKSDYMEYSKGKIEQ